MKRILTATLSGLVLAAVLSLAACTQPSSSADPAGAATAGGKVMTKLGPEFTSAWICPMHCEGSGSDKPGKCPVCEMDYRQNEDLTKPEPAKADSGAH